MREWWNGSSLLKWQGGEGWQRRLSRRNAGGWRLELERIGTVGGGRRAGWGVASKAGRLEARAGRKRRWRGQETGELGKDAS